MCKYKLELYFLLRITTIKSTETMVVKYLIHTSVMAIQIPLLNIYVRRAENNSLSSVIFRPKSHND